MADQSYMRIVSDHSVYIKKYDGDFIILLLNVDDMLLVGQDKSKIDRQKKNLSKFFAMKDLGSAQNSGNACI